MNESKAAGVSEGVSTVAGKALLNTLVNQGGVPNERLLREQIVAIEAAGRAEGAAALLEGLLEAYELEVSHLYGGHPDQGMVRAIFEKFRKQWSEKHRREWIENQLALNAGVGTWGGNDGSVRGVLEAWEISPHGFLESLREWGYEIVVRKP